MSSPAPSLNPSLASGLLLALIGAIAFSGKAIIVKLAYRHGVDAVTLIMYRMVLALPFFILLVWLCWVSLAITSPAISIFWDCSTSAPAWSG
jgi:drug/metabolite transporter (DMT)-like permease